MLAYFTSNMPPHSIAEWMVGQNFRRHQNSKKKSNGPRHVVSFEVLTDDESGSDLYKIAVPRRKPVRHRNSQGPGEHLKSALKQTSKIGLDPTTGTMSEETSEGDESSDEELDPTCPCTKCVRGRRKLKHMEQARANEKKKRASIAVATAVSSGEESDDEVAAAVHAKHQARKWKKVSFVDDTSSESGSGARVVKAQPQAKKDKKRNTAVVSVSSGDESDSEASVVEAKVDSKKGKVSVAMALTSGDESESEASVVQKTPQAKKGKKAGKILTPESSLGESESDVASATTKQAQNQKTNAEKSKHAKGNKSKDSTSTQNNTTKNKKKNKQAESTKSESESSDSSAENAVSDIEDTEEEDKAQSAKKSKQKGKDGGGKKEKQQKADKKGQQKKSGKKKDKSASEQESESVSDTEPGSAVEVKSKKSKKKVRFPPAYPAPNMREPNLLLPPRTSVMQVEHALEVPQDPRPNAFYDNDSGTMRVYHGPAYGNPYGALYPRRVYNYQNLPVGVPHPMHNPWYNGFPTVNGQPAPPHVPPQGGAIDESNPWFRGWGTVGPAPIPPNLPPIPTSTQPPPDFARNKSNKNQGYWGERRSLSPPKDREAGWDSNVIPSIEVTAPNGSPIKGAKAGSPSGSTWGAQGASGSKRSLDKQAEKKKRKKDANDLDAAISDKLAAVGKALQEAAAKDSADLRAREERWSNRSGSSKEASPQPNSGWGDNANNATSNSNNGGGWGAGTGNDGGWGNNNTNNNNGGGSGWDAPNTNAGGDSSWDNAAANNNNNAWGNSGGSNSGWDNANTNNNNNADTNNSGWGQTGSNSGWGNNSNNGGPSNTNTWPPNDDNRSNNGWAPAGPNSSPVPGNATPIPGTWASPVPSHSGSVKGKGKENGWGDATLAQSSGGYWDTKEGQADIARGTNANNDGNDGNGSW
ncbi:hypothetical protein F4679DRAFT_347444 [Xylaria curta]|nr:hypothetical protein F4679DRAFT_347444 [Xylaria curta]